MLARGHHEDSPVTPLRLSLPEIAESILPPILTAQQVEDVVAFLMTLK